MNTGIIDIFVENKRIPLNEQVAANYLYSSKPLKDNYIFAGCVNPRQAIGLQYVSIAATAYRQIHQDNRKVIKLNLGVNKQKEPYKLAGCVNEAGKLFLICDYAPSRIADIHEIAPIRVTCLHDMFKRLHSHSQKEGGKE